MRLLAGSFSLSVAVSLDIMRTDFSLRALLLLILMRTLSYIFHAELGVIAPHVIPA